MKSTALKHTLERLSAAARSLDLTDSAWAARAGVRKETLSRLRGRASCDLSTLARLAGVVGARIGVLPGSITGITPDGHFPEAIDRQYEEQLVELCRSREHTPNVWLAHGPRFFMAGLAVLLASAVEDDRRTLLALAEELHPGASEPVVFDRWLARSPLKPTRFYALLGSPAPHATR